jgi:hypothetical protein
MESCTCPDPALCQRLKRHITGRLWEIWNNVNIDPKVAQQYRDLWERQAKTTRTTGGQPEGATKSGGCGCRGGR